MKDRLLSALLVILSLSAVTMLFNLWYAPSGSQSAYFGIDPTEMPNSITQLIDVGQIQVKQGDDFVSYMYDKGNSFGHNLDFFSSVLSRYDLSDAMTEEDYKLLKTSDYIAYELGFKGSVKQIVTVLTNAPYQSDNGSDNLQTILLSSQFNDRVFVKTSSGVYMVTLGIGKTFDFVSYLNQIEPSTETQALINSDVLFNEFRDKSFNAIDVTSELDSDQMDVKDQLSNLLFGDRQDFVQELIDVNGATLMLYGYGEKTLKIGRDGLIDYAQNIDKRLLSSEDASFYEDVSRAYAVINKLKASNTTLYLRSATPIAYKDASGYAFKFYYRINNSPVDNVQHTAGVKIKIAGSELISYTRDVKLPKSMALLKQGKALSKIVDEAVDSGIIADREAINLIHTLYVQDILTLIPTYKIKTNSKTYYFDAETGDLLFKGGADELATD